MAEQDLRVIQVTSNSAPAINEALRQLSLMIYRLEGRTGTINLRDSLALLTEQNGLFGGIHDNSGVQATYEVSAEVDGRTVNRTYVARGATFSDEATPATVQGGQWTALCSTATIMSLHETGVTLYYNSGLTIGLPFVPTVLHVFPTPGAKVSRSTNQTIADTTDTAISFDTTDFETPSEMVDLSKEPTQIVVQVPGRYLVGACVPWANSAAGRRIAYISKNGETTSFITLQEGGVVLATRQVLVGFDTAAIVGDFYELHVIQTSGGPLDVSTTSRSLPNLWAQYQGP